MFKYQIGGGGDAACSSELNIKTPAGFRAWWLPGRKGFLWSKENSSGSREATRKWHSTFPISSQKSRWHIWSHQGGVSDPDFHSILRRAASVVLTLTGDAWQMGKHLHCLFKLLTADSYVTKFLFGHVNDVKLHLFMLVWAFSIPKYKNTSI